MTVDARSVGRVRTAYRLPEAELEARSRLDGLLARALDLAFDDALARVGVAPEEEVCVRAVAAPAQLRLAATDAVLVSEWGAALATALAAAIRGGEPAAVRYASRSQALVDVAVATAAGDSRRAWAWRQLGLWPDEADVGGAEAVARLVEALCAEPRSVVPVLVAAARRGALPRLAVLLGAAGWLRLARAALAAAGGPAALLGEEHVMSPAPPDERAGAYGQEEHASASAAARRVVSTSVLAAAALGSGAAAGLGAAARRALAVLATIEVDPAAPAAASPAGADTTARLVDAVARELNGGVRPHGAAGRRAGVRARAAEQRSARAAAGGEPDARSRPGSLPAEAAVTLPEEPGAPPEVRRRAWTRAGGLLFLLHLCAEVEPPAGRTLRWTLHRLALALLPELDEADPAALAFAGLGPDDEPPSDGEEPATEPELDALGALAAAVARRLAERLEREPAGDLVAAVCARRAEIVADPGWIEVRLATEELDVDVRRAGLDLDPGWLPRLGVVVRFAYE